MLKQPISPTNRTYPSSTVAGPRFSLIGLDGDPSERCREAQDHGCIKDQAAYQLHRYLADVLYQHHLRSGPDLSGEDDR